jgi:hypothetical protein
MARIFRPLPDIKVVIAGLKRMAEVAEQKDIQRKWARIKDGKQ